MNDYLECQLFNHAWYDFIDHDMLPPATWAIRLSIKCERCGSERHDLIARGTGELVSRSYVYPPDYREAHLGGGKAAVRVVWEMKDGRSNVRLLRRKGRG